jgi:hypothetical protein
MKELADSAAKKAKKLQENIKASAISAARKLERLEASLYEKFTPNVSVSNSKPSPSVSASTSKLSPVSSPVSSPKLSSSLAVSSPKLSSSLAVSSPKLSSSLLSVSSPKLSSTVALRKSPKKLSKKQSEELARIAKVKKAIQDQKNKIELEKEINRKKLELVMTAANKLDENNRRTLIKTNRLKRIAAVRVKVVRAQGKLKKRLADKQKEVKALQAKMALQEKGLAADDANKKKGAVADYKLAKKLGNKNRMKLSKKDYDFHSKAQKEYLRLKKLREKLANDAKKAVKNASVKTVVSTPRKYRKISDIEKDIAYSNKRIVQRKKFIDSKIKRIAYLNKLAKNKKIDPKELI